MAWLNSSSFEKAARTSAQTISHATTTQETMASRRAVAESGPKTGSGRRTSRSTEESTALRTFHRARSTKLIQKVVCPALRVQHPVDLLDRVYACIALSKKRAILCDLK